MTGGATGHQAAERGGLLKLLGDSAASASGHMVADDTWPLLAFYCLDFGPVASFFPKFAQ